MLKFLPIIAEKGESVKGKSQKRNAGRMPGHPIFDWVAVPHLQTANHPGPSLPPHGHHSLLSLPLETFLTVYAKKLKKFHWVTLTENHFFATMTKDTPP